MSTRRAPALCTMTPLDRLRLYRGAEHLARRADALRSVAP